MTTRRKLSLLESKDRVMQETERIANRLNNTGLFEVRLPKGKAPAYEVYMRNQDSSEPTATIRDGAVILVYGKRPEEDLSAFMGMESLRITCRNMRFVTDEKYLGAEDTVARKMYLSQAESRANRRVPHRQVLYQVINELRQNDQTLRRNKYAA